MGIPGDLGLGQGPGRWNPFGFEYTAEEYAEKQLQEIKHCRLAMLGIVGLASKASDTDIGVLQQLGLSSSSPEFTSKAGFYFQRASRCPPLLLLRHLSLPVSAPPPPFRRLCRGVRLV